jgi:iron(III) transport system ATP-binding protein
MSGPAPAPAAVALDGIAKKFGAFVALRDISLAVEAGDFVCFLGPSGCGKTTLLRIIAGLERQNAGAVRMAGRDVSALPPAERNYGIVFQSYALFPNLTVGRNVAYGLETRRMGGAAIGQRVEELLTLVGLTRHKDKYPAQLSGGEQQRVALARALAPSPSLLLLDEPLSALDARVRQSLRHEMRALQRRLGVTTIMVTHDQEEALTMADRIVVMNAGQIEQVGVPKEVYRRPNTPFVARFVGQMNFISARASERSGWARVGTIELRHQGGLATTPGQALTLAIRPEEVLVGPAGGSGGENRVLARISAIQFLGSYTRLQLEAGADGLESLESDVADSTFTALGVGEGGEISIVLQPDALRAFPAGAAP